MIAAAHSRSALSCLRCAAGKVFDQTHSVLCVEETHLELGCGFANRNDRGLALRSQRKLHTDAEIFVCKEVNQSWNIGRGEFLRKRVQGLVVVAHSVRT
jgi:hypothetical protein